VFRRQLLDFIRTIDVPELQADSEGCVRRLAAETDAVIQFYTVELQDESRRWNTTILMADSIPVDADAVDYLKSVLSDSDVQWLRSEEACPDIPAAKSLETDKKPPALPVGLAMRLLEPQAGLNINLAPKESHEVKVIKRDSLIAANALAGVLIVAVLAIAALKFVASRSAAQITDRLSAPESESLSALSAEKKAVDAGILKLSGGPEKIKNLIGLQNIDLPGLLSDLKRNTPKALQITQLNYDGRRSIIMEGRSLSYEAVRMFERMMIESQYIESVSLSETGQDEEYAGLIAFVIECTAVEKEVK
jgi:Tfp pilus assembly protein PilN